MIYSIPYCETFSYEEKVKCRRVDVELQNVNHVDNRISGEILVSGQMESLPAVGNTFGTKINFEFKVDPKLRKLKASVKELKYKNNLSEGKNEVVVTFILQIEGDEEIDNYKEKGIKDAEKAVETLSKFVNVMTHDANAYADAVVKEHRFLQQEIFNLNLKIMERWAKMYKENRYDARNEAACKLSYEMLKKVGIID